MAKTKKKEEPDEPFDYEKEYEKVHPLLKEGFIYYLKDKKIKNSKDFKKQYDKYGGFQ